MNDLVKIVLNDEKNPYKKLGAYHVVETYNKVNEAIKKGCKVEASDGDYVYLNNHKEFNCSYKFFHIDYDIYDYVRKLVIRENFRKQVEANRKK